MREAIARGAIEISIHALRVEGDPDLYIMQRGGWISIHALRVEGDDDQGLHRCGRVAISIHALRVEGDGNNPTRTRGRTISIHALRVEGDLFIWRIKSINQLFLSTPSGWRAT